MYIEEEETEVSEEKITEDTVVETAQQQNANTQAEESQSEKTYTEAEVEDIKKMLEKQNQEKFDEKFNKRWGREKSMLERENSKRDRLIELLQEQTQAKTIDELISLSEETYGAKISDDRVIENDEKKLGYLDAQEILDMDLEEVEKEAERLASKKKRSVREETTFMELGKYLTNKKEEEKIKKEIKENGIDEEIAESKEFKNFMEKFDLKKTPIKEIYSLYEKLNPVDKPFKPGSTRGKTTNTNREYFTKEEFMALTAEDLDDPKIYEKAMKSKDKF